MRTRLARALLLLVPLLASACGSQAEPAPSRQAREAAAAGRSPNILLVVIDTLRRDTLEPEEGGGGDMPLLARRARQQAWFPQASSPSSWTVPAMASLLTGLAPQEHQLHDAHDVARGYEHLATLPALLAQRGYRTGAWFGGLSDPLRRVLGQGFADVHDDFLLQRGPETLGAWLARCPPQQPWLLLLHTYEAHDPYGLENHPPTRVEGSRADLEALGALQPGRDTVELVRRSMLHAGQRHLLRSSPRFAPHAEAVTRYAWSAGDGPPDPGLCRELEAAYRAGARALDQQLERTLAWMEEGGYLANTLWVVTADHGESFGQHGMLGHGRRLDDELLRIPLVLGGVAPFDRPLTCGASVGLTDLLPTLLERVGAPVPAGLDGASFLAEAGTPGRGRPVVSAVRRTALHTAGLSEAECVGVRSLDWKWTATWDRTAGTLEERCHDLRSDPGARDNLLARQALQALPLDRATCEAVSRVRARFWARASPGSSGELSCSAGR